MGTTARDVTGGCEKGVGKWSEKGGKTQNWRESETMGKTSEKMGKPSEFGD
jgi:hypothetical protein